ncbi:MAG: nuclease-related domain-containing protein [Anaerolineales bacterium]
MNRPAGKSTREMADRRRKSSINTGLVVLIAAIILGFIYFNSKTLGIGGAATLIILFALKFLADWYEGYNRRKTKEEKRAIRGAEAEENIGYLLDGLGEDYCVLNDVESPYGNIDHIVIGKNNGIFLIETKSHHGKVDISGNELLVNGKSPEKNFIGQTLKNTYWLKERVGDIIGLQPWITPILVFTNAFVPYSKPIKNIHIINKRFLLNTIFRTVKYTPINNRIWDAKEGVVSVLEQENKEGSSWEKTK